MAHKFTLNFKQNMITRSGPHLVPEWGLGMRRRGKIHPGTLKCYEYVIKDRDNATLEDVQLAPIKHVQVKCLFGPATVLSSRRIVYPCIRGGCHIPCPCLLCAKIHPRCRVAGQSCGCEDCVRHFKDHSYHAVLHGGCKFCHKIMQVFPYFNFFLLDSSRKIPNRGVCKEEQVEPSFKLPPGLRSDMVKAFLERNKWQEKLKIWHSGVKHDSFWCFECSTLFFKIEMFKEHILRSHKTAKIFRHNCVNDNQQQQPRHLKLQCDQCSKTFGSKGDINRHVESVHYQERFECPSCDLTFTRKDNLEVHTQKQHAKTCGKKFKKKCETCGKNFKSVSELFWHSEESNCLPLTCEICKKTFTRHSDLRNHRRDTCNHEKEVSVVNCDQCETTFIRTSDLLRHQQKRFKPDGSAKFVCSICYKKLCNPKLLMAHIKAEHGGYMKYLETSQSCNLTQV